VGTAARTLKHRYLPLEGSLNPIDRDPLPALIRQLHLAGKRDKNIPAELIRAYAVRQFDAEYRLYDNQSHVCCWQRIWPEILEELNREHRK